MYAVSMTGSEPAHTPIINRLGCGDHVARTVHTAMRSLLDRGSVGARPFGAARGFNLAAFKDEALSPLYGDTDPDELALMFQAAWLEGIQASDRIVVELDSGCCCAECRTCGEDNIPNGATECPSCESDDIKHMVQVTADGPFAALWSDVEPCVLGKTWETEGDDFAFFTIENEEDLAQDLRDSFGFKLDTGNYEEV